MEFNVKIQELRRQKGMTQEELADKLHVSRTAVSKWESGRGYPNIDSLKQIAKFFSVSVDALLSGDELLVLAEEDGAHKKECLRDLLFGMLDFSVILLLFLPLFAQRFDTGVQEVSLLALRSVSPIMKYIYFDFVCSEVILGVLLLALQNCTRSFWVQSKWKISLLLNVIGVLLFVVSLQVYAAILLFVFLIIKALLALKSR